jgi:hypothetical protein
MKKRRLTSRPEPESGNPADLEEALVTPEPPATPHWLVRPIWGALLLLLVSFVVGPIIKDFMGRWRHPNVDPTLARYAAGSDHKSWWVAGTSTHLITFQHSPAILLIQGEEYTLVPEGDSEGSGGLWCNTRAEFVGQYLCNSDRAPGEPRNDLVLTVTPNGDPAKRLIFHPME